MDLRDRALAEPGITDQERKKAIGQLMAEMADRAWQGYMDTRKGRYRWTEVNWVLGIVGVISSAVGGSVLFSKDLGDPGRWIIGALAILGGLAAGLTALLNPAEEHAHARIKSKMYEDCWRETWQYAIATLATAELAQAEAQLRLQRARLRSIDIATGLLHELDVDADGANQRQVTGTHIKEPRPPNTTPKSADEAAPPVSGTGSSASG